MIHRLPIAFGLAMALSTAMAAAQPPVNPLAQEDLSQLEGAKVYGGDDGKLGSVTRVLMKPEERRIDRLVVSSGEMLGVGGHRVALPLDQFTWDAARGVLKVPLTAAELNARPSWVEGAEGSSAPGAH